MASAISTKKLAPNVLRQLWDHDPGATGAVIVSPDGGTTKRVLDLGLYARLGVAAMATVVVGGITKIEIVASAAADMSNPVVVKDSGTIAADASGDWAFLECSAEEVKALGDTLRYVAGRVTCANAGDEAAVLYEAYPRFIHGALTPATTIA